MDRVTTPGTIGRYAAALSVLFIVAIVSGWAQVEDEKARAAKIIGPMDGDNSCANCHIREAEAWKHTTHFRTFVERHRSAEAKTILSNMGARSMKLSDDCRGCHYTSVLQGERLRPMWGITCESCHGAGKEWNDTHNKVGGDPAGTTLKWGDGRSEAPEAKEKRMTAARSHGMIDPTMTYEIAANCFRCHTVPNEKLVNQGKHTAGSDFDLVAWSQGEVRHNYLSSEGAPDNPTNRPATAGEKRRLYVVGTMVDLEISLRNLITASEKEGDFHKAMRERVQRARKKMDAILAAVELPGLQAAVSKVPGTVDGSTALEGDLPDVLAAATRKFAAATVDLSAMDSQIPSDVKGTVFE